MTKTIMINGEPRKLCANALLPKIYRREFGSDLIGDLKHMEQDYQSSNGSVFDSDVFERLTWLMLRSAGEDVGDTPDEWLATIDNVFGLYELLPDVIDLWASGLKTTSVPKKK